MASFNGYIELSPSTAFLWDEIKEPRASSELERALEDQFNLPHEKSVENVLVFLKEFRENGIVTAL